MDQYVTGTTIKRLREKKGMTQAELAQKLYVSDKAVSKWETGRGYPDISFLEPLAKVLGISIIELLSGNDIVNTNKNHNINKTHLYVCPVCGNIITSTGEALVSCCGITLPDLEAEKADEEHMINVEQSDGDYFVTVNHEMSKTHYISFLCYMGDDSINMIKMYPEWNCQARFQIRSRGRLYAYCNHHGLFYVDVRPVRKKPDSEVVI